MFMPKHSADNPSYLQGGLLLLLLVSALGTGASAEALRKKTAVDLVYTWGKNILRFRPLDYVTPPEQTRMDILLGRNFGFLTGYLYLKCNSLNQRYLGTRLDYTLEAWKQRVQTTFQVRGFVGLNRDSQKHFYIITNLNFRLDGQGRIRPGILEYGIKRPNSRGVIYVGPALTVRPLEFLRLRLSYGFDILSRGRLLYFKSTINL
jgi:hypothetical protein